MKAIDVYLEHQKLANSLSSSESRERTAFQSVSGYSSKLEVSPSYDTAGIIGGCGQKK